jgi:cell shape-determining protein MreD
MFPIVIFLTLFTLVVSGITTIPFSLGLLAVSTVIFKNSWVFFLALGLGLFLDLTSLRFFGLTGLILVIFVLLIRLYERKFETKTATFIFIITFFGSLIYLNIFDYSQILLQSLVNSLFAVLFFKLLWLKSDRHSETI